MSQKPETRFRATQVVPFLKSLKHTTYFSIQQRALRGVPDLLLCCNGVFVALELKSERGSADPLQLHNLQRIRETFGLAILASPANWEEAKALILSIDQGGHT